MLHPPCPEKRGQAWLRSSGRAVTAVLADDRRFKQIVLNLLTNAVKFALAGGRVTIRDGLSL